MHYFLWVFCALECNFNCVGEAELQATINALYWEAIIVFDTDTDLQAVLQIITLEQKK